jgi:hypothetical protein
MSPNAKNCSALAELLYHVIENIAIEVFLKLGEPSPKLLSSQPADSDVAQPVVEVKPESEEKQEFDGEFEDAPSSSEANTMGPKQLPPRRARRLFTQAEVRKVVKAAGKDGVAPYDIVRALAPRDRRSRSAKTHLAQMALMRLTEARSIRMGKDGRFYVYHRGPGKAVKAKSEQAPSEEKQAAKHWLVPENSQIISVAYKRPLSEDLS